MNAGRLPVTVRCFIAIDIGEETRREIETLIRALRRLGPDLKWLTGGQIHLTLKFLGNTEETMVVRIEEALKAVAAAHRRFTLTAAGTGVFPDYSRPRVLWIGISGPEELDILYNDIETAMERLGYRREARTFRPHLTIARVKTQKGLTPLLRELRGYKEREFGKIEVSEILLMKSTLKPTGAEYERLFSAALGKEE